MRLFENDKGDEGGVSQDGVINFYSCQNNHVISRIVSHIPPNSEMPAFVTQMDEVINDTVKKLPQEMLNYMHHKMVQAKTFFKNAIQLELVVDTNIVFAEVRSLVVNKECFFLKIADNPFIKVYAPRQLREELIEKIRLRFPKDRKTRDLDIDACIEQAELVLAKIHFNDEITADALAKAKSYLDERDPDDVSFLALNFSLKTHGVLTKDKDISEQPDVRTWRLAEAGRIVTELNKGGFSFVVLDLTLPMIWQAVYGIIASLWQGIVNLLQSAVQMIATGITSGVQALAKASPVAWIFMVGIGTIIYRSEELREQFGDFFKDVKEGFREFIANAKEFFLAIWRIFKEIVAALSPFFTSVGQMLGYMAMQSQATIKKMEELEAMRA